MEGNFVASLFPRDFGLGGRGGHLAIPSIIGPLLAALLVFNRIFFRIHTAHSLGSDDFCIMSSMVFLFALCISNLVAIGSGYGRHASSLTPDELHRALQMFFMDQLAYKLTINLSKLSVLFLYLRVFPPPSANQSIHHAPYPKTYLRYFRVFCKSLIVAVVCYAGASFMTTCFECTPTSYIWDKTPPAHGECINLTAFWYSNAIFNIISDLLIVLSVPPIIWHLTLPLSQKMALSFIFGLGLFVLTCSVLRMTTLDPSSKTSDPTYGTLKSTIWTTIEASMAIICACLPMIRQPLQRLFPCLLRTREKIASRSSCCNDNNAMISSAPTLNSPPDSHSTGPTAAAHTGKPTHYIAAHSPQVTPTRPSRTRRSTAGSLTLTNDCIDNTRDMEMRSYTTAANSASAVAVAAATVSAPAPAIVAPVAVRSAASVRSAAAVRSAALQGAAALRSGTAGRPATAVRPRTAALPATRNAARPAAPEQDEYGRPQRPGIQGSALTSATYRFPPGTQLPLPVSPAPSVEDMRRNNSGHGPADLAGVVFAARARARIVARAFPVDRGRLWPRSYWPQDDEEEAVSDARVSADATVPVPAHGSIITTAAAPSAAAAVGVAARAAARTTARTALPRPNPNATSNANPDANVNGITLSRAQSGSTADDNDDDDEDYLGVGYRAW